MFVQPAEVPHELCMPVYRIMHNTAGRNDWIVLDQYNKTELLGYIACILKANGIEDMQSEMDWWKGELNGNQ